MSYDLAVSLWKLFVSYDADKTSYNTPSFFEKFVQTNYEELADLKVIDEIKGRVQNHFTSPYTKKCDFSAVDKFMAYLHIAYLQHPTNNSVIYIK